MSRLLRLHKLRVMLFTCAMTMQLEPDPRFEFDLADRLRRALRVSGVSVQELADDLEVNRNTVGNWINGHTRPRGRDLRLIAMRTGFPRDWLESGVIAADRPDPGSGATVTHRYRDAPLRMPRAA